MIRSGSSQRRRARVVSLTTFAVTAFSAMPTAMAQLTPRYQGTPRPCILQTNSVPVYFHQGDLSGNIALYRESLLRAIATWNEESHSARRLYFAGDAATDATPVDTVVVSHASFDASTHKNFCQGTGSIATATSSGADTAGRCISSTGVLIRMLLNHCASPYAPRSFTTAWPVTGEYSYEAIALHELGHAAFGLPDFPDPAMPGGGPDGAYAGIMDNGYTSPILHADRLHLYAVDQNSVINIAGGNTSTVARTWLLPTTNSLTQFATVFGITTSVGPGLAPTLPTDSWLFNLSGDGRSPQNSHFGHADGSTYMAAPQAPIPETSPSQSTLWSSTAISTFGEMVVARLLCSTIYASGCELAVAYSPDPYGPSVYPPEFPSTRWRSDFLSCPACPSGGLLRTFARPVVAYDSVRDRFVVIVLGNDGRPFTAFAPAERYFFDLNHWSQATPGYSRTDLPIRYTGGLFFDSTWTGSPETSIPYRGYFLAAAGWQERGVVNHIVSSQVTFDGVGYVLSPPTAIGPASESTSFQTFRHFGLAGRWDSNGATIAWGETTPPYHRIRVSRLANVASAWSAPSTLALPINTPIYSSVSLANDSAANANNLMGASQ